MARGSYCWSNEGPITCLKCGKEGHIARGCMAHLNSKAAQQGNEKPSTGIGVVSTLFPRHDFTIQGYINDMPAKFLIDTGAAVTMIASQLWEKCKPNGVQLKKPTGKRLVSIQGDLLHVKGLVQIKMNLGGILFNTEAVVADSLMKMSLSDETSLGLKSALSEWAKTKIPSVSTIMESQLLWIVAIQQWSK